MKPFLHLGSLTDEELIALTHTKDDVSKLELELAQRLANALDEIEEQENRYKEGDDE